MIVCVSAACMLWINQRLPWDVEYHTMTTVDVIKISDQIRSVQCYFGGIRDQRSNRQCRTGGGGRRKGKERRGGWSVWIGWNGMENAEGAPLIWFSLCISVSPALLLYGHPYIHIHTLLETLYCSALLRSYILETKSDIAAPAITWRRLHHIHHEQSREESQECDSTRNTLASWWYSWSNGGIGVPSTGHHQGQNAALQERKRC